MKAKMRLVLLTGLFVLSGCSGAKFRLLSPSDAFFVPEGTKIGDVETVEDGYYFSNPVLKDMGINLLDEK